MPLSLSLSLSQTSQAKRPQATSGHWRCRQRIISHSHCSQPRWELYYPPFEAALAAGAGAVMCSYNRVNGSHACENDNLLNRDLKERMGFSGFVMSDWDATHSTEAIEKGLDMEQPSAKYFQGSALAAVNADAVKQAARRVLASIYHMRLDEHPGCALPCDGERSSNQRTAAHLELAEQAPGEGGADPGPHSMHSASPPRLSSPHQRRSPPHHVQAGHA